MGKWWLDYGDIDHAWTFHFSESEPEPECGMIYGPFKTFGDAKEELIFKLRDDIGQLRSTIDMVKLAKKERYMA